MESAPVSPRRHSAYVNRSDFFGEDGAASPTQVHQQQQQQQKEKQMETQHVHKERVGSGALGKKGSLISLLGQNVWPSEDLRAMDPERGSGGYETEHRTGPRRRRSSFLQNMADYLAYSSTLESNSDRPQCPIPQGPPSRRGSCVLHEQDDLSDITPEEAAMYSTQSANARRASVAPIVSESSVAAYAVAGAATRPAAEHMDDNGNHHRQDGADDDGNDDDDDDEGGKANAQDEGDRRGAKTDNNNNNGALGPHPSGDEEDVKLQVPADSARLLEEAFTFATVDDEARAASPGNRPAAHSPSTTDGRGARSPGLRRRRRASVSTPFETISEEEANSNKALIMAPHAPGHGQNGKPAHLTLPSSPLCHEPQSPLDFPTPKLPRGKKKAPKPHHPASTIAAAATATTTTTSAARPAKPPVFKASTAMVGLPRATAAETVSPLSQQEVMALRQMYEHLHEEQQELLREARFHRRTELVAVSVLTATATALAIKYLL